MSVRLQHLFDAVDTVCKSDHENVPQEALDDLCVAWGELNADKIVQLIQIVESWAKATEQFEEHDVAINLLRVWQSYLRA